MMQLTLYDTMVVILTSIIFIVIIISLISYVFILIGLYYHNADMVLNATKINIPTTLMIIMLLIVTELLWGKGQ